VSVVRPKLDSLGNPLLDALLKLISQRRQRLRVVLTKVGRIWELPVDLSGRIEERLRIEASPFCGKAKL
jgi:hypothetical protein